MKKIWQSLGVVWLSICFLAACSSAVDLTQSVKQPQFSGLNGYGAAHSVELDSFHLSSTIKDPALQAAVLEQVSVSVAPQGQLANGDDVTITVSVPEHLQKYVKGGTKTVTVAGLEEPTVLTADEVAKHLVVRYLGVSGKGTAEVTNVFNDSFLQTLQFEAENNGELVNGQDVEFVLNDYSQESLLANKYVLEEGFQVLGTAHSLQEVPANATDIANLEDIKRMINEQAMREYNDDWMYKYEVALNRYMYRQFPSENTNGNFHRGSNHGVLMGIFTVKVYDSSDNQLEKEFTGVIGYSDIILDAEKRTNVASLVLVGNQWDKTYSLDSIYQLYEGYGFVAVP
ncbi:MAG: hypothetical protein Q4B80_03350 [Aerococcaceae bacterium]|nr:hypothetical protein [Aerococcaceae bacterium]